MIKLVYMLLATGSLYLAFLVLTYLPTGFRELLLASWVGIALYCLFLFARPENVKKITSYDRQRNYRRQLLGIREDGIPKTRR